MYFPILINIVLVTVHAHEINKKTNHPHSHNGGQMCFPNLLYGNNVQGHGDYMKQGCNLMVVTFPAVFLNVGHYQPSYPHTHMRAPNLLQRIQPVQVLPTHMPSNHYHTATPVQAQPLHVASTHGLPINIQPVHVQTTTPMKIMPVHVAPVHVESAHVVPAHIGAAHVVPSHIGAAHVEQTHVLPSHIGPVHVQPAHVVPTYVRPVHVAQSHVVPAYVRPAHVVPTHVRPVLVEPAHIVPAHVLPTHVVPAHIEQLPVQPSYVQTTGFQPFPIQAAHSIHVQPSVHQAIKFQPFPSQATHSVHVQPTVDQSKKFPTFPPQTSQQMQMQPSVDEAIKLQPFSSQVQPFSSQVQPVHPIHAQPNADQIAIFPPFSTQTSHVQPSVVDQAANFPLTQPQTALPYPVQSSHLYVTKFQAIQTRAFQPLSINQPNALVGQPVDIPASAQPAQPLQISQQNQAMSFNIYASRTGQSPVFAKPERLQSANSVSVDGQTVGFQDQTPAFQASQTNPQVPIDLYNRIYNYNP